MEFVFQKFAFQEFVQEHELYTIRAFSRIMATTNKIDAQRILKDVNRKGWRYVQSYISTLNVDQINSFLNKILM